MIDAMISAETIDGTYPEVTSDNKANWSCRGSEQMAIVAIRLYEVSDYTYIQMITKDDRVQLEREYLPIVS
jgi:hypothetical protein